MVLSLTLNTSLYPGRTPRRSQTTNINASIVDLRVTGMVEEHPEWFPWPDENRRKSAAFVVLCMSTTLDLPLEDCIELLTDGGNDAGVDGLYIGDVEEGDFVVTIFQGKYRVRDLRGTANFPENDVRSVLRTLEVLFDPYRQIALNERIAPLIADIRSLILDGYIPTVRLVLCNNGARWTEQAEIWVRQAREEYGEQVEVLHFNHDTIVRSLQRGPHVDTDLTLSGGIVTEDLNFSRVLIGRISVHEVHRIFQEHGDQLLERNVRRFLGRANRTNTEIRDTLLDPHRSPNFYVYNNGITVICNRFDYNALQQSDHRVRLQNLQVVNGGQTCKTIHQTLRENPACAENSSVLIRIYQLPDESGEVVHDITRATNSQSPVDLRDLRSNDELERALALGMEQLGYTYKRHRDDAGVAADTVTSGLVAETVLAVWRERPHQAKFRRREHFGKLYDTIFRDLNAAQALLATHIFRMVERRRREGMEAPPDFLPYASHHLAMVIGRELRAEPQVEVGAVSHRNFATLKEALENDGDRYYSLAIESLEDALRAYYGGRQISLQQLAGTFRSGGFLEMLNADGAALA